MKVIVCGGRKYNDVGNVYIKLDEFHATTPITELMQGGATGADFIAKTWAEKRGITNHETRADWKNNGRAAGAMRNSVMLKWGPDVVIAFPGGTGTDDMIRKAIKANVKVVQFE